VTDDLFERARRQAFRHHRKGIAGHGFHMQQLDPRAKGLAQSQSRPNDRFATRSGIHDRD
jgi:hypothetical protein